MFKKLKEKLKTWTKNVSEEIEEKSQEKIVKEEKITEESEKKENLNKSIKLKEKTQKKEESKKIFKTISSKISKTKISEENFQKYTEDLEMLLLENNVALEVVEKIIFELKEKLLEKDFNKKELQKEITNSLKEIIEKILIEPFDILKKIKEKKDTYIILFCGINGTGKTTTIAKIANLLKENNISCVFAAADTFRAASIEQIKKHAEKLEIKTIAHDYGADPAAVGFDAIKYANKNKIDCVLIDTAGRMHTDKNLIKQIEKISRVCNPDTKIFVGESITGNDIIEQVKSFQEAINIDGIILTKADIDEKGGTALSVGYTTKKPILFLGTGQEYNKIENFNKKKS